MKKKKPQQFEHFINATAFAFDKLWCQVRWRELYYSITVSNWTRFQYINKVNHFYDFALLLNKADLIYFDALLINRIYNAIVFTHKLMNLWNQRAAVLLRICMYDTYLFVLRNHSQIILYEVAPRCWLLDLKPPPLLLSTVPVPIRPRRARGASLRSLEYSSPNWKLNIFCRIYF